MKSPTIAELKDARAAASDAYRKACQTEPAGSYHTDALRRAYDAATEAYVAAHERGMDRHLARYSCHVVADVDVPISDRYANVALRLSDDTDLLVALIVAGDHVSVDITAYRGDDEAGLPIRAYAMGDPIGTQTQRISGPLLVAMIDLAQ